MLDVERKLRVHGLFRLPDLPSAGAGVARAKKHATRTLTAVYHDTDDLRLARWGVTLRRREGGEDEGWHLKLPVEGHEGVREEVRLPLAAGEPGDVPRELADLVMAFARNAPLHQVAALRTERTPYELFNADGQPFAELVDDTVSVLDGEHVAARFRELEVEALTPGAALVADRRRAGGRRGGARVHPEGDDRAGPGHPGACGCSGTADRRRRRTRRVPR